MLKCILPGVIYEGACWGRLQPHTSPIMLTAITCIHKAMQPALTVTTLRACHWPVLASAAQAAAYDLALGPVHGDRVASCMGMGAPAGQALHAQSPTLAQCPALSTSIADCTITVKSLPQTLNHEASGPRLTCHCWRPEPSSWL